MPNAVASHGTMAAPSPFSSPSFANRIVGRDHQQLRRDHDRREDHQEPEVASREPQAGEPVPGQRAQDDVRHDRGHRHDDRVAEPQHDVGLAEELRVAVEREVRRDERRRERHQLLRRRERRQRHLRERHQEQDRDREQHEVPPAQLAPPGARLPLVRDLAGGLRDLVENRRHQNASEPRRRWMTTTPMVMSSVTAKST
ncbi:hypothetical protein [Leifsonia sp. WHRI 6310E]|uniref:hypothetical protein n=1 Tax=Leifsonia sp. WHRI 6310E TaxID=3162562 RepID=UPI0032ECE4E5